MKYKSNTNSDEPRAIIVYQHPLRGNVKMAAYPRNDSWCDDYALKEDLTKYVRQAMLGAYPLWIDGFDTSIIFTRTQMSLLKKLKRLLVKNWQDQASFLVTEHCT